MGRRNTWIILMMVSLLALACGLTGGPGEEAAEPTSSGVDVEPSPEPTVEPTAPGEEATAPLPPEPEDVAVRAVDGMEVVLIPGGEFLMGDDASAFAPEKPAHIVYLDEYWIDRYEVSNAQYRLCVEAEVCPEPGNWWNEDLNGDGQPVLVPWEAAQTYCEWAGGRLPTEAEWEKAIRGTDGRTWPWGNEFEPNRANLSGEEDGYGPTAPVGSFPDDVSPYGLLDAAGNAAEWVADWWDAAYYTRSPARNPSGPADGEQRVHRAPIANAGGGPEKCRCVARYAADPNWEYGFRCVSVTRPEGEAETSLSGEPGAMADSGEAAEAGEAATPAPESPSAAGEAAEWPPLQSYRARTVMTLPEEDAPEDVELEGPLEQTFLFEWDAAASASRTVVGAVEEITIGDRRWTRIRDMPWTEQTLTPDEQAAWEEKMSFAQLWGDADLLEEDLESALPEDVELVPAQIFPVPIKAAMVYDGEETVNDVRCKRYTVDTDLDYTRETGSHTTGHATGVIWVADQEGIPPVIVRSVMEEDLVVDGDPSHPSWEYDLTEVNQPVTIEQPE